MKKISKSLILVLTSLSIIVLLQSCEKQSDSLSARKPPFALVSTSNAYDLTPESAILGGFVSLNGKHSISERGITYGFYENPTVSFTITSDGTGPGPFTSFISGLTENTVYYVRAYAVINGEIFYGKQVTFRTPQTDPSAGAKIPGPDFPGVPRDNAVSVLIGDKLYYGLGYSRRDLWVYDQGNNLWTRITDYPGEAQGVSFAIGKQFYLVTGFLMTETNMFNSNEFWEYDTETDKWTNKDPFPGRSRGLSAGFSIGNKGYIGSGVHTAGIGGEFLNDFWEWDQLTNIWTTKANYPGRVEPTFGFSVGTKGYMGTSTEFLKEYWEWDQSTNVWKSVEELPEP